MGLLAVVLAAAGATAIALALPGGSPPQPPLALGLHSATPAPAGHGASVPSDEVPTSPAHTDRTPSRARTAGTAPAGPPPPGSRGLAAPSGDHATSQPTLGAATPLPDSGSARPAQVGPVLPRSIPVSIRIPAIEVDSSLLQLGLNADGSVQVPPLNELPSRAGWYRYSPTPGQIGPAVILGHVDSAAHGPAVFYRLGALRPGDQVLIHRADGSTAVFRVDRTARYPKTHFPTDEVYGNINHAGLRLITCGGSFDFSSLQYDDDIVVYASLASTETER